LISFLQPQLPAVEGGGEISVFLNDFLRHRTSREEAGNPSEMLVTAG
jgi:hypothetical protein